MTIIYGTGELAQDGWKRFCKDDDEAVFYSNDRREWGRVISGRKVIDFNQLTEHLEQGNTELIYAADPQDKTAIPFLKDVCPPHTKIRSIEGGQLVPFDLDRIGENYQWWLTPEELEQKNLEDSIKVRDLFAAQGKTEAYAQAVEYIRYKKDHLLVPDLDSIEITNSCNLNCPNCGTPISKFPKGFMSEEIFDLSVKHLNPAKHIGLHGVGEPLLHPKLLQYIAKLVKIDKNIIISTNAVLLDQALSREIFSLMGQLSESTLMISFHTKKSVENWVHCLAYAADHPNIHFMGQVLDHNKETVYGWLKECGIDAPESHPRIRHITSHSWAGNVSGRKVTYQKVEILNRIRNCYFLRNRLIRMRWDGTITVCCLDTECTQRSGTIFDLESVEVNRGGYELCSHCDPDWTSKFQ